ncbi:MAG: hypothetical protein M1549_02135, partial [Candidatus Dependentiae bacterium]|nr:hypothetical protein [Candidatus Dependentiae bacterium]
MMKIVKHTLFALLLACGTWTVQSEAMEESLQSSTTTNNNSSSYSTESDQGEKILEAQKKVVATYILTVRGGQVKLLCKKTSGKNENEGLTPATFKDKEEQNEKLGCKIIPITGLGITYAEGESKEYNLTFMFMQDQIPAPAEGAYEFANLNTLRSESSKVFQMQLFWNEGSFKQFEHDLRNCWKKISWQLKAEPEDHYFVFSLKPNEKDPNQPARVMQLQERLYKDSSLYAPVPFGRVRDALEKNGYAQFATTTCDQEHIAGIAVPFSTTLPEGYGWKPCTISDQVHAKQAKKAARPMQINYNDDLYLIYLALDTEIKELNKNNQGKEKEKEILEAIKNKSSIFQTEEEYEQEEKLEQLQAEIDPKLTASCINFDDNKIAAPAVFFHVTGEGMEVLVKGADLNNNGLSRNNPVLEDKDGAVSTLFAEKEPVGPTEDNKLEEKAYKIYNVYSAEEPKGFCWRPIDETENNTEGYHFLIKEAFKKLELSNNEGIH